MMIEKVTSLLIIKEMHGLPQVNDHNYGTVKYTNLTENGPISDYTFQQFNTQQLQKCRDTEKVERPSPIHNHPIFQGIGRHGANM